MFWRLIFTVLVILNLGFTADSWNTEQVIYNISASYQKAKAREVMGSYKQAVDAYEYALKQAQELLRSKTLKKEQTLEVLPYAIASAYRLSVANEKYINGRMVYIYEQMERYKSVEDALSEMLTTVSNLRIDQSLTISPDLYGHIYYARAINGLAMSYCLANGTLWKKYLVYMPSDIVLILGNVQSDLEHYEYLNGVTSTNITEQVAKFNERASKDQLVQSTLQLSYYSLDTAEFKQAMVDRFQKGIQIYLQRYANSREKYKQVADLKTYEEFEQSQVSRWFIAEIKNNLELLKTY